MSAYLLEIDGDVFPQSFDEVCEYLSQFGVVTPTTEKDQLPDAGWLTQGPITLTAYGHDFMSHHRLFFTAIVKEGEWGFFFCTKGRSTASDVKAEMNVNKALRAYLDHIDHPSVSV